MSLTAKDITIAITVFNRRQFLKQAIGSALEQTTPGRVMVVEDCGPDPALEGFVRREFGSRIDYFRNPQRRGLFGNWNACLDHCQTPWLSILHDDDFLAPGFVSAMVELSHHVPNCGLYFGQTQMVNEAGESISYGMRPPLAAPWRQVKLTDVLENTPFPFPGHIFRVDYARTLGSFRETSQFAGDWEMWANLIGHFGAAQTSATVAYNRSHGGLERGTSKITLNGRLRPLVFVQQKRVIHLLRQKGAQARFCREEFLRKSPMSASYLTYFGGGLTPRLLRYNVGLLLRSTPPSWPYAVFQTATRVFGTPFVRLAGWLGRVTGRSRRF